MTLGGRALPSGHIPGLDATPGFHHGLLYCAERRVKIYTKTGDRGETAFLSGQRISKADPRVDAYGEVDELGAWLGVVRAEQNLDSDLVELLTLIQRDLFALGARLADPTTDRKSTRLNSSHIQKSRMPSSA